MRLNNTYEKKLREQLIKVATDIDFRYNFNKNSYELDHLLNNLASEGINVRNCDNSNVNKIAYMVLCEILKIKAGKSSESVINWNKISTDVLIALCYNLRNEYYEYLRSYSIYCNGVNSMNKVDELMKEHPRNFIAMILDNTILYKIKEDFPKAGVVNRTDYNYKLNYVRRCLDDIDYTFAKYGDYELSLVSTNNNREYKSRAEYCNCFEVIEKELYIFMFNLKTKKYLKINGYKDIHKTFSKV